MNIADIPKLYKHVRSEKNVTMLAIEFATQINGMPMKEQVKLCEIALHVCKQKAIEIQNGSAVQSMQKKKNH
jgi:hypothetical protein